MSPINLGDVCQKVEHTARVTPLVVVPADELDEVVVERDTGLCIENGAVCVAPHVRRDDIVLGVLDNSCCMVSICVICNQARVI